jgi:hypothetical protein
MINSLPQVKKVNGAVFYIGRDRSGYKLLADSSLMAIPATVYRFTRFRGTVYLPADYWICQLMIDGPFIR